MTREEKVKVNKPFADRLKQLREDKGVTAKQASQDLNGVISGNGINSIEAGYYRPDYEKLVLLAEYYGVTTDWLLGVPGAVEKTTNYRELIRDIKGIQEELNYNRMKAQSYERTILKLSAIIAEGKHEDN